MSFFERITNWLGFAGTINPDIARMRRALDDGRRAKRAEDFVQAMAAFDEALQIAHAHNDPLAEAVIQLHRADVLVFQGQFSEAEEILRRLRQDALERNQSTQLAYVVCLLGALEQSRNAWTEARRYYEEALEIARNGQASGAEGRAMGHLADTYLHDGNASYAAHLLRDALPRLDSSGDIELSSYFVGRLGEALVETGSAVEGRQLVERALRLAEHMRYRTYERLWRIELGRLAFKSADYQNARQHIEYALKLFDKLPPSSAQADALGLISNICLHQQDYDEALKYARQAEGVAGKLDDARISNNVQGMLGIILRASGNTAEAVPYLEAAARAYADSQPQEGNAAGFDILRSLAAAQAESGAVEQAVETYRRAVARAQTVDAPLELAQSRRDLGLLYSRQGRVQQALSEWEAALTIYEAQSQHQAVALLHCDIGNARHFIGQGYRALKEYEQALMLLNAVSDPETRGIVLSTAANAYVDQGDIETAESFFSEAIEIAQRFHHKEAEATRLGNYAWFLLSTGRFSRAESLLDQSLRMSRDLKLDLQIAVQTDNQGLLKDESGEYEAALALHNQAVELIRQIKVPHWEAVVKINLANTQIARSRVDEAGRLLEETLAVGRETDDIEIIIRSLIGLARVDVRRKNPAAAKDKIDEATTQARKADMRRLKAEVLLVYSEQQAALGQHGRAVELWNKAQKQLSILRAPQADRTPAWLSEDPAKTGQNAEN